MTTNPSPSSTVDNELFDAIVRAPILPTVLPLGADVLCDFAEALVQEGYPAIEILSRPLDQALTCMRKVNQRPVRGKLRWGMGTLLTRSDALAAVELRPDFLVSPAFSRHVLEVAAGVKIPYIPAVHTFQDVQNVLDAFSEHGLKVRLLKLCPIYGLTPEYVRSLCGCFPGITFCPTGEVTLENYMLWKSMPGIAAPMGSRFIAREMLEAGDFETVRQRLREIRDLSAEANRK